MSQPALLAPDPIPRQPSSHSPGSFGPVLIVLAVIAAVSVLSCVAGRLCSRRSTGGKETEGRPKSEKQESQDVGTKERDSTQKPILKVRDLESGLVKNAAPGAGWSKPPPPPPPQQQNSVPRSHVRFAPNA